MNRAARNELLNALLAEEAEAKEWLRSTRLDAGDLDTLQATDAAKVRKLVESWPRNPRDEPSVLARDKTWYFLTRHMQDVKDFHKRSLFAALRTLRAERVRTYHFLYEIILLRRHPAAVEREKTA